MKRFQFSISAIFALTIVVAMVLSMRGGLASESPFETIWIASFLLSYWRSPRCGWRQIFRALGTMAVVWGVLILCVYLWYVNRRGAPSAVELALHGGVILLAAVVAAFAGACLVEAIRAAVRFWLRGAWSRRVVLPLASFALISLVMVGWIALRASYWEPAALTSAAEAFDEGFPCLPGVQEHPELKYVRRVVASPDNRFVAAILNGHQRVLVFDSASRDVVASFTAGSDQWFSDLTFHPDGGVLAAIVCSKTAGLKLARWDVPSWAPREPAPLDHLVDRAQPGESTCLALDRCLLVVRSHGLDQRTGEVDLFTVELLDQRLAPRAFASGRTDLKKLPRGPGLSTSTDPKAWIVAPSGNWIATSADRLSAAPDYLFCADTAPTRLRGRALGFFRNTDCVGLCEGSIAFYWRRQTPATVAPPFWDYCRIGGHSRVTIYDCRTQRVIARSRWFTQLQHPRMSADGSQVLAEQGDSVLIWEFAQVSRDRERPLRQRS
jgi:hypothetical protein